MQIVKIELHRLAVPLRVPFETSSHRKRRIEHILVEVLEESGLRAWGEIACGVGPWFSAEYVSTSWSVACEFLAPTALGKIWDSPSELSRNWDSVRGHQVAKAGFEGAAWALYAAASRTSLARRMGHSPRAVPAGISLGIEPSIKCLLHRVEQHLAEGYHRVKIKIAPDWDIEPVAAIRREFPSLLLHVDANAGYSSRDIGHLAALDDYGLAMIEQPFRADDLLSHATLSQNISTAICLDESIESVDNLRTAHELGALQRLNIKISRVGGITPALEILDESVRLGLPAWVGGMHELGVGRATNLAFASHHAFNYPPDLSEAAKYFDQDIVHPTATLVDGALATPDEVGLGVEVDMDLVHLYQVDNAIFHA